MNKIERQLNRYEHNLTRWATKIPLVPGVVHLSMGTLQAVIAAVAVFIGLIGYHKVYNPMLNHGESPSNPFVYDKNPCTSAEEVFRKNFRKAKWIQG